MAKSTRKLRPQPWDWPHPRVLLELPEGDGNGDRIAALRGAGYSVAVCPGPRDGSHCPLAGDDGCAVADEADIVVSSLGLHRPVARETLAALRKRLPELPVLVEAPMDEAQRWPELVRDGERLEPGLSAPELVARVDSALAREWTARA